jgi:hypothetical protein
MRVLEAAASNPVLLAIDDVHWADRSTLDLLTFLLGRLRDERLMLVLTFRSDELDRRAELRDFLAEAGRRPITRRVELERLTRDELGAQLEGILERAPDARFVEAVFPRPAGNALFADADALAFRHRLLREAACDEALPGERARLHAAFAQALERRPELAGGNAAIVAAEIAHHWWRAGDRPRALRSALDAGLEAERANAPAEAAVHLVRVLDLWDGLVEAERPPGVERATVLARAAEATAWSGSPERAVELASAALDLIDEREEPIRAGLCTSVAATTCGGRAAARRESPTTRRRSASSPPSLRQETVRSSSRGSASS